jgi:hypothetical protein
VRLEWLMRQEGRGIRREKYGRTTIADGGTERARIPRAPLRQERGNRRHVVCGHG